MPDERYPQLAVRCETGRMCLPAKGSYGGVTHESSELRRAFAEGPIAKRLLDHPKLSICWMNAAK